MFAKLILLADEIAFDDAGRLSAKHLALDVMCPKFPHTLENLDLLTLWTRTPDEPAEQSFEILLQTPGGASPPEAISVNFGESNEVFQGLSLAGFELDQPGPYIFRFLQNRQDRGVWILRAHPAPEAVGEA